MKYSSQAFVFSVALLVSFSSAGQTPAPASPAKPASTVPASPAASDKSSLPEKAAPGTKKVAAPASTGAAAAGGGDGKVWVNPASKTYHCFGSKYYGKTKKGEYLTEADAKTKGNHADHKKACS